MKSFSEPGKITDNILMLDAYGWRTSKTTSSYIILGEKIALIEPAHRSSAEKILEGMKNFNVDRSKVFYILVSHRHFDHSAGAPPLLKYLPNAIIGAHLYTIENFKDPEKLNKASQQMYGDYAEPIEQVRDEEKLRVLKEGEILELGNGLEIEVVHTPGHTSDHYAYYERKNKFMFTGDAVGIFGCKSMSVIPTAFPPSFKYEKYMKSLEKMLNYDLEIVSFAHFGSVVGKDVNNIIHLAIETLKDWKNIAEEVWETSKSNSELAKRLSEKYQKKLEVFPKQVKGFIFQILAMGLANSLFQRK
ncbi:MAG: MBL fold metallo-hydrolase [Candidatus Baldrarchaeia archaeon]